MIHDVAWLGNGAFVNGFGAGGNNTIANNTMYNGGSCGVLFGNGDAPNTLIQHNDVSRYGDFSQDRGAIYAWSSVKTGSVIAYNRIHDSAATSPQVDAGIYMDNGAGLTSSGVTIHHNLTVGIQRGVSVNVSSSDMNIYNNTFWGASTAVNVDNASTSTNINTVNNLSNSATFNGTNVSNNRYQTANQFTNSAAGDYTLTANSSGTNQSATHKRRWTTARRSRASPTGYAGSNPDAGAFESGRHRLGPPGPI